MSSKTKSMPRAEPKTSTNFAMLTCIAYRQGRKEGAGPAGHVGHNNVLSDELLSCLAATVAQHVANELTATLLFLVI